MRLIIFLLALSSAFFQLANASTDDYVPPEYKGKMLATLIEGPREPLLDGNDYLYSELKRTFTAGCEVLADKVTTMDHGLSSASYGSRELTFIEWLDPPCTYEPDENETYTDTTSFYVGFCMSSSGGVCVNWYRVSRYLKIRYDGKIDGTATCPPEQNPEYTELVHFQGQDWCKKPEGQCPVGYWNQYMSKVITGKDNHCEPRDCDQAGTTKGLSLIPGHDSQGFNSTTGGLYCNDGCTYEVKPEQVNHTGSAYATSTGQHCDVFGSPNKKISELDEAANCTASTSPDGKPILSCPEGTGDDGNDDDTDGNDDGNNTDDPIDNDDKKTGGDDTEDQPKNVCQDGDTECKTENIEIAIENGFNKLIKNDNELHNLMIDVHTANTVSMVEALNDLQVTAEVDNSMELLLLQSLEQHLEALVAIESQENENGGDGGNDDGTGDPDGDPDGDGTGGDGECDPTVEECGDGGGDDTCTADYCDATLNTDEAEEQLKNYFETEEPMPDQVTNVIDSYTSFVSDNFAGFLGTCTPFPLDVQLSAVSINKTWNIGEHCEPYDNFVRPILEWFIWVITVNVIFSIFYRTIIEMGKN